MDRVSIQHLRVIKTYLKNMQAAVIAFPRKFMCKARLNTHMNNYDYDVAEA